MSLSPVSSESVPFCDEGPVPLLPYGGWCPGAAAPTRAAAHAAEVVLWGLAAHHNHFWARAVGGPMPLAKAHTIAAAAEEEERKFLPSHMVGGVMPSDCHETAGGRCRWGRCPSDPGAINLWVQRPKGDCILLTLREEGCGFGIYRGADPQPRHFQYALDIVKSLYGTAGESYRLLRREYLRAVYEAAPVGSEQWRKIAQEHGRHQAHLARDMDWPASPGWLVPWLEAGEAFGSPEEKVAFIREATNWTMIFIAQDREVSEGAAADAAEVASIEVTRGEEE